MTTTFAPKDPAEAIYYGIDCDALLGIGETLSSCTASIRLASGSDPGPYAAMLSGAVAIAGSIVKQKVQGGQAGNTYRLGFSIVTSAGQTFVEAADILVREAD